MKDKYSHFFLIKNSNDSFNGTVFSISHKGSLDFIGNNPFDFMTDRKDSQIETSKINRNAVISEATKHLGCFNWDINPIKLELAIKNIS
jgi:hypothetical protein